jgi:hypothetical protein
MEAGMVGFEAHTAAGYAAFRTEAIVFLNPPSTVSER